MNVRKCINCIEISLQLPVLKAILVSMGPKVLMYEYYIMLRVCCFVCDFKKIIRRAVKCGENDTEFFASSKGF